MKTIKKLIIFTITLCLMISSTTISAFSQSDIIIDENNDFEFNDYFFENASLVSADFDGVTLQLVTSIPTISSMPRNQEASEIIISTVGKFLPSDKDNANEMILVAKSAAIMGSGSSYKEVAEKSGAGTIYSTVSYSTSGIYYSITNVSGGCSSLTPSSVVWVSNELRVGQTGNSPSGRVTQYKDFNAPRTFSYGSSNFSGWKGVELNNAATIGATLYVTCSRGSSSWWTLLNNNLVP